MARKQEYGNESITSLKGADRVRKRPAVIFGSDGVGGLRPLHFEIVSNSIDEARDGHGDTINVTRCKDGSVIVEDFGRGMPVDWNNGEGRYNWELLFCEMYAGGKYGEGEGQLRVQPGPEWSGPVRHQYASAWMTADIYRDGFHYHLALKVPKPDGLAFPHIIAGCLGSAFQRLRARSSSGRRYQCSPPERKGASRPCWTHCPSWENPRGTRAWRCRCPGRPT